MTTTAPYFDRQAGTTHTRPQTPDEWMAYWLEKTFSKTIENGIPTEEAKDYEDVISTLLKGYSNHPATIAADRVMRCAAHFDSTQPKMGTGALRFFFTQVIHTVSPKFQKNIDDIRARLNQTDQPADARTRSAQTGTKKETPKPSTIKCALGAENTLVLKKLHEACRAENCAVRTEKNYAARVSTFLRFIKKPALQITREDIQQYLIRLHTIEKQKSSTVNVVRCAIAFCWDRVLDRPLSLKAVRRMKETKQLPPVYAKSEIERILDSLTNIKHRLVLMLTYGCGLRLGDLVELKVNDIDWERGVINIKHGKGDKERGVMLPKSVRPLLREYLEERPSRVYVFENDLRKSKLSERTFQNVYVKACEKAGINRKKGIHSLRHTFSTHSLERGTDIRYIQSILGHASLKTTMIYTHVTNENVANVPSPLDDLDV